MAKTLKERDAEVIWHPYTQMKVWPEAIGITKGEGVYLIDEEGNQYLDAIASWWVNLHGHSHPYIAQRVSEQLIQLEHCIFAGFTHEPAVQLAERLLPLLPGQMKKVFYSDNGSTAVEVALKMAYQYWQNKGIDRKRIIALEGAYHGDTVGAMSVSARSLFTKKFDPLLFDVSFIPFPTEENCIASLKQILEKNDTAAIILEPLIQGSAGMRMYGAEALEEIITVCKQHDCLVIADEVMTGFGRTGTLFACDQLTKAEPDIICLSKGLTGGTLPLGVTTCTQDIYDAFLGDDGMTTLYHGHSFTANPIACTAALASLDLSLKDECIENIRRISDLHRTFLQTAKQHEKVLDARQCGTIIALELNTGNATSYLNQQRNFIYRFFLERKILMRPLGNIIYILPPYCITNEELSFIYEQIQALLEVI
ncbi:adenosylmethionine--8-amino-7-oxononanoate transaminase [Taibaiella soli]|uniref:Adenosylmethionine-8-amino-7-oxononanoate aminotransferase n=1 Tax=Taibaiella soli TaxID=1649169 RepID=A0A2W2AGZ6_9BACT|nr:adenosylmethionine--8-amino-7-oxononanoate transaminase [Taibaiella soli]PZF72802.1 adenosylmethionine--8-amino-7-oxononanoate transaminase [Taibaiella soli]